MLLLKLLLTVASAQIVDAHMTKSALHTHQCIIAVSLCMEYDWRGALFARPLVEVFDESKRILLGNHLHTAHAVLVCDAVHFAADFHELWPERSGHKLGVRLRLLVDHVAHGGAVLGVQRCVDLVEQIEGRGVHALDGENQRERYHGFLPSGELLHCLGLSCSKGNPDLYRVVLFHRTLQVGAVRSRPIGWRRRLVLVLYHDKLALALDDNFVEDLFEVHGHPAESSLNVFVLFSIQPFN
mmetsp:Transcript_18491/g.31084  ORF Transcript_18491/g.31084 Transcript_18491/m.31084 type:complete len:240 (+) Transcript_18491:457-1176(+)